MVASTIAHYRIGEPLGRGGMGVVYRAHDTQLHRDVAVKMLPPEILRDGERQVRFAQEARAASALHHPNIVTVHEFFTDESGAYIVMELVDGKPLSEILARGALRRNRALDIGAQIADAIAAAHAAGILHRDLKPANIMVTGADHVKVVDFGLAKVLAWERPPEASTLALPLTLPDRILGTMGYMSPEQVRGEELDARSDIFNLGLLLHEMLAGSRAFAGATPHEVMSAILRDEPPELPESVPVVLRRIVATCLEKNPAHRFESAHDVGLALRALLVAPAGGESRPGNGASRARHRILLGGLVSTALVALALMWLYLLPTPDGIDLSRYRFTPFAVDQVLEEDPVWSPDGRSIAFRVRPPSRLMWRSLDAASPIALTEPPLAPARVCGWTPDGTRVLFLAEEALWSVAIAGAEPEQLLPPLVRAATLSPDGQTLVYWGRAEGDSIESLWVLSPPGSDPRRYEPPPFRSSRRRYAFLSFSPDGSRILLCKDGSGDNAELWLLGWPDVHAPSPRRVFGDEHWNSEVSFSWMPDSRHLALANEDVSLADVETEELEQIITTIGDQLWAPSVSPNGEQIVMEVGFNDADIVALPVDGGQPVPVLATPRPEMHPSWSRTGDRMAYFYDGAVWLRSTDGSWTRRVAWAGDFGPGSDPGSDENLSIKSVAIAPGGERVAYSCNVGGSGIKIWISPASGGQPVRATENDTDVKEIEFSWSPASEVLVVLVREAQRNSLSIVRPGTQRSSRIPGTEDWPTGVPVWSPDGQWIACGNRREGSVVVLSPDGTTMRSLPCPVTLEDPRKPESSPFVLVWSRDASRLYLASSTTGSTKLHEIDIETGVAHQLADYGFQPRIANFNTVAVAGALTPDGASVAVSAIVDRWDLWIMEGFPQPPRARWVLTR